ncbi:MAG: polymer-forming cytoskeletal protein [Bacteroidetes bacterium]|nr:polymer-forming cytoskeletal protein [Bacteroidota bacterium]
MFSKNNQKDNKAAIYADKVSIIAAGMVVTGDVESDGDIRIDGTINGNVFCHSKVVIISTGKVNGDIQALNVDVHGTVNGNVSVGELLSLKSNCHISGNLTTENLQIEPNASFNGHCSMGSGKTVATAKEKKTLVLQES